MNKKIGAADEPNIVISPQYLHKREGRDANVFKGLALGAHTYLTLPGRLP